MGSKRPFEFLQTSQPLEEIVAVAITDVVKTKYGKPVDVSQTGVAYAECLRRWINSGRPHLEFYYWLSRVQNHHKSKNRHLEIIKEMDEIICPPKKQLSIVLPPTLEEIQQQIKELKIAVARKPGYTPEDKRGRHNIRPCYQYRLFLDGNVGPFVQEFPSTTEAALALNINRANISGCCHGRLKSAGGYYFTFIKITTE